MIIVDTDIFIDFLRGMKYAYEFLNKNSKEIAFSALTETELLAGKECDDTKKREDILHLLSEFEKIPIGNPLAQVAGDLRRKNDIKIPDAIIAASALQEDALLVTRNAKDFEKIKELKVKKPY